MKTMGLRYPHGATAMFKVSFRAPLTGWGAMGGFAIASLIPTWSAQAQTLVLDGTTGTAQTLTGPVYEVEQALGTTAGPNLFHSFSQFDLSSGERVNFRTSAAVRSILTRVTGGSASTIDGVLATPGSTADFYLINPAGIVFGPGGKLELGGSFIGTTASAVRFGEVGEFSAVQPQPASLLNITPSALAFSANAGRIESRSIAPARMSSTGRSRFGLQVLDGKSLLLVGGDVFVDGGGTSSGGLLALGGRLELGGLSSEGVVQLSPVGQPLGLRYPENAALANMLPNIRVSNNALVTVAGVGGGDLIVNANRLEGTTGGRLVAGTNSANDAGDLVINAREIEFRGGFTGGVLAEARSGASNELIQGGTGNGGALRITGNSLRLSEGAQIGNSIFGSGSTGQTVLDIAERIELDGTNGSIGTGIFNDLQRGSAQSRGGDLVIRTRRLDVKGGAQISTSLLRGEGQSGAIRIDAEDIRLEGLRSVGSDGVFLSNIASSIESGAVGSGGGITLRAHRLSVADGAEITTAVRGEGQGGAVVIDAKESVEITGTTRVDLENDSVLMASNIQTDILSGAVGSAGQIRVKAPLLSLSSGGFISSRTFDSIGDSGNIQIEVDRLEMFGQQSDGIYSGNIESSTLGSGNAGDIRIDAQEISMIDSGNIGSSVISLPTLNINATGDGGAISIQGKSLELTDSSIGSVLQGDGERAGDISIQIQGDAVLRSSTISAFTLQAERGQGGNITLEAGTLSLLDTNLLAQTSSPGDAGLISLQSHGNTSLQGETNVVTVSTGAGNNAGSANNIRIKAENFSARNGVAISSFTTGDGDAGSINVEARDRITLTEGSNLQTGTIAGTGAAGNILLSSSSVDLASNSFLSSLTGASGDAGDIQIDAQETISLEQSSLNAATAGTGTGGNIWLAAPAIELVDRSSITAESSNEGRVGSIRLQGNTFIARNNSEIVFSAVSPEANVSGGRIDIDLASALLLEGSSGIFATASDKTPSGGSGGTINIAAPFVLSIPGGNGDISTSGIGGDGGLISIEAEGILNFKVAPKGSPTAEQLRQNRDNDISSNSQVSEGGLVLIDSANLDPAKGTAELPTDFTDPSQQISRSCASTTDPSSFVSTGRRGIPLNPTDPQTISGVSADWAFLPSRKNEPFIRTVLPTKRSDSATAIPIEVTRWQRSGRGNVVLLSTYPTTFLTLNALACSEN